VALDRVGTEAACRIPTGLAELDRVLGGGMVPGSCVLVGGEPGIGKSTLLLGMCARAGGKALYVAGEEAPEQVALRARRMGLAPEALFLLDCRDTRAVADALRRERPRVCVVDSVQSLTTPEAEGAPGGPAQVRAAAEALVPAARESKAALFLVGQVTKEGGLAGPRLLEHAVDAVLLFEGDRRMSIRALRPVKNRYGPTDEIGLFEMREDGLREVRNASDLLLQDRRGAGPGSVVATVVEGRRALCVEVQALLVGEKRAVPRHRANGADPRRAELLVGVLVSHYDRALAMRDVYVNVVGGLTVRDTGLDLAVAAAVLGFHRGQAVDPGAVVIGEVGLRGEVRPVGQITARLKEARAMGFRRAYVPRETPPLDDLATIPVGRVHDVLQPAAARAPPKGAVADGGRGG
jgi:DNA repair protein RadA/Sms